MHHHWLSGLSALSAVFLADLVIISLAPLWGNSDIRVMHTWNTVPVNWENLGPPPAGTTIDLHIALKPHHENALIDALYEVSDPRHQKYGAHMTKEQVATLVAPHQETLEIVHSWLGHHGVPSSSISTSHGGGWLTITEVPVSQADKLLCASYQLYRHTEKDGSGAILRTVSYGLPAALHAHVQTIAPTTHFASPRTPLQKLRKRHSDEAEAMVNATSGEPVGVVSMPNKHVTPAFLRWLYHTQAYVPAATDQNLIGTLGFLNDYPSQADLAQFMTDFRADSKPSTLTVVRINGGGDDSSHPGPAGTFQSQYSEAIAYPTPYIFYSTGGILEWSKMTGRPAPGDGYLQGLNYLLVQSNINIPRTISIPYVQPEREFPPAYTDALCTLFAQLGLRGVSVLVASGDDGVGPGECKDRSRKTVFVQMFPASCPWVTSVGGTTGHHPEEAAVFSGGGFSANLQLPRYQSVAVNDFLYRLGAQNVGLFPSDGRGIPDIAAQAQRFSFIYDTVIFEMSGTICSTSTAAGIISLLNDYQLSTGRAPLGFLNPWLYRHGLQSLNDIMAGSNPGCGTNGFSAIAGWDPVTGLGTLDFEILQLILDQETYEPNDDDWTS